MFSASEGQAPARVRRVESPVTFAISAGNSQYFVAMNGSDSDDGSYRHPWATISRAADEVPPGAVVHVLPGQYVLSQEIKTRTSGNASARITFISETQWGASLVSTLAGNTAVWSNAGDYVDIKGFDITGHGSIGIYNEGSHVRIIGNYIHDIPAQGCTSNGGAGILNGNYSAEDDDAIGNVVENIGDYKNPCPRVHGIYYTNLGGHARYNIVYRSQGWGIHTWHAARKTVITNNTVFNNAYGGILIGDGDGPGGVLNDYTVVSNNIVYRNGLNRKASGYGIEEYGNTGTHNLYLDNLIYQNGPTNWNLQNGNQSFGTLSEDPQFVNYTGDGGGDYHLRPTSPAIHAGTKQGALANGYEVQISKEYLGAYGTGTPPSE
jgi:parallel beta-helix repeat protein